MRWILGLVFVLSVGCGSAKIGDSCDTPSGEGECEGTAVCTNGPDGNNVCRKACTVQEDCAMNESCNGVSGSSLKSCQPK